MPRTPGGHDAVNLLELVPVRLAPWRDQEGGLVVEYRPPPPRGLAGRIGRLLLPPRVSRRRLDEVGAAVWRRLDGRTVAEVVAVLREEFGERIEPAEDRLRLFLGMLRRERLIGLPGLDDRAIAEWRQASSGGLFQPPAPRE